MNVEHNEIKVHTAVCIWCWMPNVVRNITVIVVRYIRKLQIEILHITPSCLLAQIHRSTWRHDKLIIVRADDESCGLCVGRRHCVGVCLWVCMLLLARLNENARSEWRETWHSGSPQHSEEPYWFGGKNVKVTTAGEDLHLDWVHILLVLLLF